MPERVLQQLGGAASWRQLRERGVGWYALWLALRTGAVVRLRRGVYALSGAPTDVCAAVRLGGVLACTSAALALGLPVLVPYEPHVIVPRAWSHAALPGVRVHRRSLAADERNGLATSMLRTVIDCARELPLREAVVICDAALRYGLGVVELHDAVAALRGPGSAAVRRVVGCSDGRAESPIESCLRLVAAALGSVVPQVWIAGVGRVDLLLEGWLVIEADGFAHHSSRESYREDRRRTNALVAAGFAVLRFSYEDVVYREEYVVETIRQVLGRR